MCSALSFKKGTYVISLGVYQELRLLRNEHIRICQSRLSGAGLYEDRFLSKLSSSHVLSISKRGSGVNVMDKLSTYLPHIFCIFRAGTG